MGGAPGLQLKYWPELLDCLGSDIIFHSDLMLSEGYYNSNILKAIDRKNVLIAVNIKGVDKISWEANTRKIYDENLLEYNINKLKNDLSSSRWYLTFTNIDKDARDQFLSKYELTWQYNFNIDLIDYTAMPYVDSIPWGRSAK